MRRSLLLVLALTLGVFWPASQVFAAEVTVSATVAPVRVIYLNDRGSISRVIGNTSADVVPEVIDASGKTQSISSSVAQQYEQIKDYYGGFGAGRGYRLPPAPTAPVTDPFKPVLTKLGFD